MGQNVSEGVMERTRNRERWGKWNESAGDSLSIVQGRAGGHFVPTRDGKFRRGKFRRTAWILCGEFRGHAQKCCGV